MSTRGMPDARCLTVGAHTRCATDLQNIGKLLRVHEALQWKPLRIRSIFSPLFPTAGTRTPAQMLDTLTSKWLPSVKNKKLAGVVELTVDGREPMLDISMIRAAAVVASGLGYAIRLRSAYRLRTGPSSARLSKPRTQSGSLRPWILCAPSSARCRRSDVFA